MCLIIHFLLLSQGLAVAKATHLQMLQDVISGIPIGQVVMEETDDIRRRLHAALHVPSEDASIVLFPSGSDAELVPALTALVRSTRLQEQSGAPASEFVNKPKVFNFITGAGEVGSGTAKASGARHFSNTPNAISDVTVADGKALEGMTEGKCFTCFKSMILC